MLLMALLKYFKVIPGRDLPNPDGPLSALISPKAIVAANSAVEEMRQVKKRGPYIKMSNKVSQQQGCICDSHKRKSLSRNSPSLLQQKPGGGKISCTYARFICSIFSESAHLY